MATQKQIAANRRNARLSTGPRTPEGKAVVRFNALRHGLRADALLLPDEDSEEFAEFADAIQAEIAPRGVILTELVRDYILVRWRLRRVHRVEAQLFKLSRGGDDPGLMERYGKLILFWIPKDHKLREQFEQELEEGVRDAAERQGPVALGVAFDSLQPAFSLLGRYEKTLRNQSERILNQIRKIQERQKRQLPHDGGSGNPTERPVS